MNAIFLVPLALVALVALRGKSSRTKKPKEPTPPNPTNPQLPRPFDPTGPMDGPIVEPWRPGGPRPVTPTPTPTPAPPEPIEDPEPPAADDVIIGPGPRPPEAADPTPITIEVGTTVEDLQDLPNFEYALFISADCIDVIEGPRWWEDVFLPAALLMVASDPEAYHHPVGIMHDLLALPEAGGTGLRTGPQECLVFWPDIDFSGFTLAGTLSGQITEASDPGDQYWDTAMAYAEAFPQLAELLDSIRRTLEDDPEMRPVFEQHWPGDDTDHSDLDDDDFQP